MAEKTKKYYKISKKETKKGTKYYIIIDDSVKPTAQEEKDVKTYIQCGYEIKHKSEAKAERARLNASKLPSKEEIVKALENDSENLKEFQRRCKKEFGGFFKARKWYLDEVKK